jgi:hypothetical protein
LKDFTSGGSPYPKPLFELGTVDFPAATAVAAEEIVAPFLARSVAETISGGRPYPNPLRGLEAVTD